MDLCADAIRPRVDPRVDEVVEPFLAWKNRAPLRGLDASEASLPGPLGAPPAYLLSPPRSSAAETVGAWWPDPSSSSSTAYES